VFWMSRGVMVSACDRCGDAVRTLRAVCHCIGVPARWASLFPRGFVGLVGSVGLGR
jgi:hypothetical protein